MKKLLVLSAIAALAACGGSDPKPADPTNTTGSPASTSATPSPGTTAAPATTEAPKPADPAKK